MRAGADGDHALLDIRVWIIKDDPAIVGVGNPKVTVRAKLLRLL